MGLIEIGSAVGAITFIGAISITLGRGRKKLGSEVESQIATLGLGMVYQDPNNSFLSISGITLNQPSKLWNPRCHVGAVCIIHLAKRGILTLERACKSAREFTA